MGPNLNLLPAAYKPYGLGPELEKGYQVGLLDLKMFPDKERGVWHRVSQLGKW